MRKYKASVAAVSTDQITIQDQQTSIQVGQTNNIVCKASIDIFKNNLIMIYFTLVGNVFQNSIPSFSKKIKHS